MISLNKYWQYVWMSIRVIPVTAIVYHVYILGYYWDFFEFMYPVRWLLEATWIGAYVVVIRILSQPGKRSWGYWFLTFFPAVNISRELWVSGELFNERRLYLYTLAALVLVLLFLYRQRFSVRTRYATVPLVVFVMLLGQSFYYHGAIIHYKTTTAYADWSEPVDTGYYSYGNYIWCGSDIIASHFTLIRPSKQRDITYQLLNIKTGGIVDLGNAKLGQSSTDGQWLLYIREESSPDEASAFIRYHVPSRRQEVLGDSRVHLVMPSNGQEIVSFSRGNPPLPSLQEPKWPVIPYRLPSSFWKPFLFPDGKQVLLLISSETPPSKNEALIITDIGGNKLQDIPLPAVNTVDFKISPEGDKIYTRVNPMGIQRYDLQHPEAGWSVITSKPVGKWTVSVNGTVMFSDQPNGAVEGEDYLYLGQLLWRKKNATDVGIWLYTADMTQPVRLTSNGNDFEPVISPDGKAIAFSRGVRHLDQKLFVIQRKK